MQKRTEGVSKALVDLVSSGMRGQLQQGDTLGLWTFNNKLHAGTFPLQDWAPDRRDVLASRFTTFIRAQKYEKSASLSEVMPVLTKVLQSSEFITVVLISAGDDKISGTPFDDRINKDYKLWRDQQEKAHMPVITILRATRGTVTDYSVTPSPFQVELPPLPKAYVVVAEKPPAPKPAPPPPRTVEPLIISGHKSTATPATTTVSPLPATTNVLASAPSNSLAPVPQELAPAFSERIPAAATALVAPQLATATNGTALTPPSTEVASTSAPTNAAAVGTVIERTNSSQAPLPPAQVEPLKAGQKVFARELTAPSTQAPTSAATEASISVASGSGRPGWYWTAALTVAGLAVALLLVFARRQRAHEQLSLITRSLERGRK